MRVAVAIFAASVLLAIAAPAARAQPSDDGDKSPAGATLIAVGATVVADGLMWLSLVNEQDTALYASLPLVAVAPAAGHIYAGEHGHALTTSLIRGASLAAIAYGGHLHDPCKDCDSSNDSTGFALMAGGALVFLVVAGYDLYDAHRAAKRHDADDAADASTPSIGVSMRASPRGSAFIASLGGSF